MQILLICGKSDHLYTILSIDEIFVMRCNTHLTGFFQMLTRKAIANCRGAIFTFFFGGGVGFILKIHLHPEANTSEINKTLASIINSSSDSSIETLFIAYNQYIGIISSITCNFLQQTGSP